MSDSHGLSGSGYGYGSRALQRAEWDLQDLEREAQVIGKAAKKDRGGAMVGTGSALGALGLAGGGIPIARPDSGRLANVQHGTKREASRHLVSAARGGIFGYREDAHRSYLNRQQSDLKGWKADNRGNHFERGIVQGKTVPEKQIIRHMRGARVGANAALVGGAALIATGHQKHRSAVGKASDHVGDALIAGGLTTAGAGAGGSALLNAQGRKWSRRSAAHVGAAQQLNPKMGGYDTKTPKGRRFAPKARNPVPDVVPHRNSGDLKWNNRDVLHRQSNKHAIATGKLRGAATQERYFARVYGSSARTARKLGGAGAVIAAGGVGAKYLQVKPRPVSKATTTMSDSEAKRIADRYDIRGALPKTLSRDQRMKAYEGRFIAAGGHKVQQWNRRADHAETGRNVGLAGATALGAASLAGRVGRVARKAPHLAHRADAGALGSAVVGGASELYGEHARSRRDSYKGSPAGVAGSALTRMQAYTKEPRS